MAYKNLKAEMARLGVTGRELSRRLGKDEGTISCKINGHRKFSLDEAFDVQAALKSELPLDILFARERR
jgi:hypothetical protein